MLIDWDAIGVPPPDGDLRMVVSGSGQETRPGNERPVDPAAPALSRIRLELDD
jgi:hypothetical protein